MFITQRNEGDDNYTNTDRVDKHKYTLIICEVIKFVKWGA